MNIAALQAILTGTVVTGGTIAGAVVYYEPGLVFNDSVSIFVKSGDEFSKSLKDSDTANKVKWCVFDDSVSKKQFECTFYVSQNDSKVKSSKTADLDLFDMAVYKDSNFQQNTYYKIDADKDLFNIWIKNPNAKLSVKPTKESPAISQLSFNPLFAITSSNKMIEIIKSTQTFITGRAKQMQDAFNPLKEETKYSEQVPNYERGYLCSSSIDGYYSPCKIYDFGTDATWTVEDSSVRQSFVNDLEAETNGVKTDSYYKVIGENLNYDPMYVKQNDPVSSETYEDEDEEDYEEEDNGVEIIKIEDLHKSYVFDGVLFVLPN